MGAALLLAGVAIGILADPYLPSALSNAKKGYQSGFATAKKLVEESRYGNYFRTPDDIRFVGGTVTAINGDRLTIHTASANPFDDPALNERTVLVDANTKVDLSTIKVGSSVVVIASENVKAIKEFTASEIQLQPEPPVVE